MGLDMFLNKRFYVGASDNPGISGVIVVSKDGKKLPIRLERVSYIEEEVAYWRKANQIHKWFVDNIQDGVDDCKPYHLQISDLEHLLDTCKAVMETLKLDEQGNIIDSSIARELLPTESGFFFGDTGYNESYYDDIKHTISILEEIIQEGKSEKEQGISIDYAYQSSW